MCNPASFVVTKDQVFWSKKSDSHEDIISEFELKEMNVRHEPTFVRVEISPENGDLRLPIDEWIYKLDQDVRPNWYEQEVVERRCRVVLKKWAESKLIIDAKDVILEIKEDRELYIFNSTLKATTLGNSTLKAETWDNSTLKATTRGNSTLKATTRDNSTLEAETWDNSTLEAETWDDSTIISYTKQITKDCLKSNHAVLVDRSDDVVKCYVGSDV